METTLKAMEEEIFAIFSHLHENPEISWKEYNTTEFIKQQLLAEGFRVQTFDDCTGVVGEIGEGDFIVGLRADIDALWQQVDGEWRANHSCGHDAHMTMALGAVKLLRQLDFFPNGRLRVIFQPAEEKGSGALKMLEKGVLDGVQFLYGVHVRPIQDMPGGYASPAIQHGASQMIQGEIVGLSAHAARPHLGVNPIEVGASLVTELKKIHVDPLIPYSIKMTRFQAGGESGNIIPDYAEFTLDVRAQTNELMDHLQKRIAKIADSVAGLYDAEIRLKPGVTLAAAQIDEAAKAFMEKAICRVLGADKLKPTTLTSGGEDFHFYTLKKPEVKATMLGLGCNLQPGLHHPKMTFDRHELLTGIQILAAAVMETFQSQGQ